MRKPCYAQAGAYFVTLCSQNRECLFGKVENGKVILTETGLVVARCWEWLAEQYASYVSLDEWVVMPNHLHGIIILGDWGGS
jgi:putative transposase